MEFLGANAGHGIGWDDSRHLKSSGLNVTNASLHGLGDV
jgi:hypothetical protein